MTQQGHSGGSIAQPAAGSLGSGHTVAAGAPTDQTVPLAVDGALHVDTAGNKIWTRIGGVWKSVAVA